MYSDQHIKHIICNSEELIELDIYSDKSIEFAV